MKILYIANNQTNDFLSDAVFHGLKSFFDVEVTDYHPLWYMYNNIGKESLVNKFHGRGFSYYASLPVDEINRDNIVEKIQENYYDRIIYGNVRRCLDLFDIVSKYYDPYNIMLFDGNDEHNQPGIFDELVSKGIYFRRELSIDESIKYPNVRPISFAFPKKKMNGEFIEKTKVLAHVIPGIADTFIFNDEDSYYHDYQTSLFAYTWRKAGWDCLRHYEILCNQCIPLFLDIEQCPETICTTIPKQLLIEYYKKSGLYDLFDMSGTIEYDDRRALVINRDLTLINNLVIDDEFYIIYTEYLNKLYEYSYNNLTTHALAHYVLQ